MKPTSRRKALCKKGRNVAVKIGISPIAWQNDDLPAITAAYTMEQALREAREIGYTGVERGQRMPQDTEGLRAYLEANDIALCGGWFSGQLLHRDLADEKEAAKQQVEQFIALGSPCMVYGECSNTVQGDIGTPVNDRPRLTRDEAHAYAHKMTEFAKWCADQGMPLAYHHHMGAVIEAEEEVDWLMEASGPELRLCFDTGHLLFGGGDVMATLRRWSDRVEHVHYKDIRPEVVKQVRETNMSFLDAVIAGAFTVPGDGCIDFGEVSRHLKAMDYDGWIVVEAEQDPAKAPPYEYSKMGYDHIIATCKAAGLEVDGG
jgi:inosose dehydratase